MVLLATSSNKRIAERIECNKKGLPRDLGWRSCVRMMNEATDMMIAMKEFHPDIWNGNVRAANMAAAEEMIAKLGPRFTPQYVMRITRAGSHIAAWALGELENTAPLRWYMECMGPDCKQISVSMLVNLEPAISALEGECHFQSGPLFDIQSRGWMMGCSRPVGYSDIPNPKGPDKLGLRK
ncbi:ift122 [Symbiodinium sp. CCMP2592]|nr:ift122 [Symbiodinium sp. CCMP2592]